MGSGNLPPSFCTAPAPSGRFAPRCPDPAGLARRRQGRVLPLQPAGGVGHRAIFFGESGAGQAIDRGLDIFHFVRGDSRRLPELAGFVLVDFADDQPVGFFQCIDIFLESGPMATPFMPKANMPLTIRCTCCPRFGSMKNYGLLSAGSVRPSRFLSWRRRRTSLSETDGKFRGIRPVVERVPRSPVSTALGVILSNTSSRSSSRRVGHFQIAG